MSNTSLSLSDDFISLEDITDRVEELRSERDDWALDAAQDEDMAGAQAAWAAEFTLEAEELSTLEALLEEMKGYGGNHQWEGGWYPDQLIAADAFEGAMDELIDDIGDLPKNLPSYLIVSIDYEALRQDYTEIEVNGSTYLYR